MLRHIPFLSGLITFSALVAMLLVATETSAKAQKITLPMTDDPAVMQVRYRPYGTMLIAAMIRNIEGKVAVCGFWTESDRFQAYVISPDYFINHGPAHRLSLVGKHCCATLYS